MKKVLAVILIVIVCIPQMAIGAFSEEIKDVAKIGDVKYQTLDAAISAVQDGEIIELLEDCTIETTNTINKPIFINGNGYAVDVKPQPSTAHHDLSIHNILTFDNTKVSFKDFPVWTVTMGGEGCQLNFLNGTVATFANCNSGIYADAFSEVNVAGGSELSFFDLEYNAFMGDDPGEYIKLNVTDSDFIINRNKVNGLNWVDAYVKNSNFTIQNVAKKAAVTCNFVFDNSVVHISDGEDGFTSPKEVKIINGSKVSISNLTWEGFYVIDLTQTYPVTTAGNGGQSVYVDSSSSMEIFGCGNASGAGIGIYSANAHVKFENGANVKIHDNNGFGIRNQGEVEFGVGTVINKNGSAVQYGGGIYNDKSKGAGTVTIHSGAEITENQALKYGGGIYNTGTITIDGEANVNSNTAELYGGGIYNSGTLTINGATEIFGNKANQYQGGGIFNIAGTVSITGAAQIHGNEAGAYGGGISVYSGTMNITGDAEIYSNTAGKYGGGIYNAGTVSIDGGAKVDSNTAQSYGGGIFNITGNITIKSGAKVCKNNANYGGGICVYSGQATIVNGAELYNNHARTAGDDIFNYGTKGAKLNLGATGDWILDDCGDPITGWFNDYPADYRWNVHGDNPYAVQVSSGVYEGKNVYFKAAHGTFDLKITKEVVDNNGDRIDGITDTFLFTVKGQVGTATESVDLTVAITGNGSVTIKNLPIGTYTVTEKTDWSWQYSVIGSDTAIVTLSAGINEVPFKNIPNNKAWLGCEAYNDNIFTGLPIGDP